MAHVPVLLNETLEYLNANKAGKFVDGTVGGGGHLRAILSRNETNEVLGIDLDQASLRNLESELTSEGLSQKIKLVSGNYANIDHILQQVGWDKVDGILLDFGFSSLQLDDSHRGFAFATDGPLDMRYDQTQERSAESVVNKYSPKELEDIIENYGEERMNGRIAAAIVSARKEKRITTTAQLAEIIRSAIPGSVRFKANDNIRRVFQAIRIEVNQELENLKKALPKMVAALNPKGRLVIISFHSLEDRIVKTFFVNESKDCVCPAEFPTCVCGKTSTVRILSRKPKTATELEISLNPRSKPAKLRALEKN